MNVGRHRSGHTLAQRESVCRLCDGMRTSLPTRLVIISRRSQRRVFVLQTPFDASQRNLRQRVHLVNVWQLPTLFLKVAEIVFFNVNTIGVFFLLT